MLWGVEWTGGGRERAMGWGGCRERERERDIEGGREESNERILKLCANKIRGHLHLRWDWVAGVTMATFPRVFKRPALPDSSGEKEKEGKEGARYMGKQWKQRDRAKRDCGVQPKERQEEIGSRGRDRGKVCVCVCVCVKERVSVLEWDWLRGKALNF